MKGSVVLTDGGNDAQFNKMSFQFNNSAFQFSESQVQFNARLPSTKVL